MKQLILLSLFVILSGQLIAQPYEFLNYSESEPALSKKQDAFKHALINEIKSPLLSDSTKQKPSVEFKSKLSDAKMLKRKVDYELMTGMSVGTSFNNSYFTNNYIIPSTKIELTPKLSAITGIGYSYSRFHNYMLFNEHGNFIEGEIQKHSIIGYASLDYKFGERTHILASVMFDKSKLTNEQTNLDSPLYKEMSLGVNYQVTRM